jgi:iron complex outermembrane recepter protein
MPSLPTKRTVTFVFAISSILVGILASAPSLIAQTPQSVVGSVADASGAAVPGATIVLTDTQGKSLPPVYSGPDGIFSIDRVATGRYMVRVEKAQFGPVSVPLEVAEGAQPQPLRITLEVSGVSETVTVTDEHNFIPLTIVSGATKTDTPILDLPRAIQIIPAPLLEDRQVVSVAQAIENVSGVNKTSTFYDAFLIRGFSNAANSYRNSLKTYGITGVEDFAFVDHLEVAKGPNSTMYGRIAPGGLVNYLTKQPLDSGLYSIQQQVGSWGQARTVAEATGPLNSRETLLYRAIGTFDRGNSFIQFQHHRNWAQFGAVSWRPVSRFSLNLQAEGYQLRNAGIGGYGQQIPAIGSAPANLPRNWTANDPTQWDYFPETTNRGIYTGDWTFHINDKWKLTQRFLYNRQHDEQNSVILLTFNAATGILTRKMNHNPFYRSSISGNFDLAGTFKTGFLRHTILAGQDVFHRKEDTYGYNEGTSLHRLPDLNIYAPAYGMSAEQLSALRGYFAAAASNLLYRSNAKDLGAYLQDQMHLSERLSVLLGGRYDWAQDAGSVVYGQTTAACFPNCDGTLREWPKEREFSPNAGLLYRLKGVSLFSSYAKSFSASNTVATYSGLLLAPQKGKQYEAGAKSSLFGGRVLATLTLFQLHQFNMLDIDAAHPGFYNVIGEARSRGIEFDVNGQVTRHVGVVANYTYDDARIVQGGTLNVVNRYLALIPHNSSNVWVRYETKPGSASSWMFGAGTYLVSGRFGESTNTVRLHGYGKVDGMIGYRTYFQTVQWTAQLNANNIFDKTYFEYGSPYTYGAPRAVMLVLKAEFGRGR